MGHEQFQSLCHIVSAVCKLSEGEKERLKEWNVKYFKEQKAVAKSSKRAKVGED